MFERSRNAEEHQQHGSLEWRSNGSSSHGSNHHQEVDVEDVADGVRTKAEQAVAQEHGLALPGLLYLVLADATVYTLDPSFPLYGRVLGAMPSLQLPTPVRYAA